MNNNLNLDKKKSYINRVLFYNENGKIDYKLSSFYTIKMEDTIQFGDTLHFCFKLNSPFIKSSGYGRLEFRILDSNDNNYIQMPTTPPFFMCKFHPQKRGTGYIYGTVLEIDDTTKSFFRWYVKEKYYVK